MRKISSLILAIAWEQRKLGDIGKTYGGLSGKSKEDFGHGGARFVTYMNVFSNPVGDPGMTEAIELDGRQNEVKKGDIFFTTSSETPEEVGMSCVWMENMPNTYLNSFCFGYRPIVELDLYYLAYVLRSSTVRHKFIFLAQGISRYNISKNKAMEMLIPVPNMEEQVLLGAFFKNFDNLITLHQCKRAAFMSRKSPPIFQFEKWRNTLTWEQRKLDECGVFTSNGVDKLSKPDEIPVSLLNLTAKTCIELMQVTARPAQIKNNDVRAGDVFFTPTSETAEDIGHSLVIEENLPNTVYSYHLMRYRPHSGVFFKTYPNFGFDTKYLHNQMTVKAKGVQRFVISKPDFEDLQVICPSYREQESIASFLTMLDNLITLHQRGENIYNRRQTW